MLKKNEGRMNKSKMIKKESNKHCGQNEFYDRLQMIPLSNVKSKIINNEIIKRFESPTPSLLSSIERLAAQSPHL